jgi:hypothetical protein
MARMAVRRCIRTHLNDTIDSQGEDQGRRTAALETAPYNCVLGLLQYGTVTSKKGEKIREKFLDG